MYAYLHAAGFRRFIWFLIFIFTLSTTPHAGLVLSKLGGFFVSTAYADTIDTPILGRIVTDRLITGVAQAPDTDTAYGINSMTKDVYAFDLVNYALKKKTALANTPVSLGVHPATNNAFVIQTGGFLSAKGYVSIISPAGDITNTVNLASAPRGIAVNVDDTIAITFGLEKKIRVFNASTLATAKEISLSYQPKLIALDTDSNRAVVSAKETLLSLIEKKLLVVDLTSGATLRTLQFSDGIRGVAVDTAKNEAVVVTFSAINIVNIDTGAIVATFPATFTIKNLLTQLLSGDFSGGIPDLYFGVDINQSTHKAIVSSDNGFIIVNLNDNTTQAYSPEASEGMIALAVDMYRNSFLVSYLKVVSGTAEKGVLEIQLPNPAPVLTSLSPLEAFRGSEDINLAATGEGFVKSSSLFFNSNALTTTFTDNENLSGLLPKDSLKTAGTYPVTVVTPEPQGGTSEAISFSVKNPAPTISSVNPSPITAGSAQTTLSIIGTNYFNDSIVSVNSEIRPSSYVSATELQTSLTQNDLAIAGTLGVIVTNPAPGGGSSSTVNVTVTNPLPSVVSVSPSSVTAGSAAVSLTVTGTGFVSTSKVTFNGVALPSAFVNPTTITATVPSALTAAAGSYPVAVVNLAPGGGVSSTVAFSVVNPAPALTAVNPNTAVAGSADVAVTLTGSSFMTTSVVTFNGTAIATTYVDPANLTATVPATLLATAGNYAVVVVNPAPGGGASNGISFSVTNAVPVLLSISPNSVSAGSSDVAVTLTGSNFSPLATIIFNNANLSATVVNATTITSNIPSSLLKSPGAYPVVVSNPAPGGGASSAVNFTVKRTSTVEPLPEGSFGEKYQDLIPADATIQSYDPKRFSIITGVVNDATGIPLPGVTVSLHSKGEYGTAQTDAAGRFSLPLDGGGLATVTYSKTGFIPSQRQVETPWNGIVNTETLVMIAEDAASTAVAFNGNPASITTHTSTPYTDDRGTRSVSMIFTGDNRAYIKNADGTETETQNITVRATEFTTPESMPAKLPPASAYTYCAELSADGAKNVRFENPVTILVDNFLNFPVGSVVPVGYYDRDKAVWVPSQDGVVVTLLDTDGDGIVDSYDNVGDGQAYGQISGLTDPARFVPGKSYWMANITHFTPWDCNWPYVPPEDATPPNPEDDPTPEDDEPDDPDCKPPCCGGDADSGGSYVVRSKRTVNEDISIPGTNLYLHYASNRTKGYKNIITVPVSGETVPKTLKRIYARMEVAGRIFLVELPAAPNLRTTFIWDGLDYRGQAVTDTVTVKIDIGFVYGAVYSVSFSSGGGGSSFGLAGGGGSTFTIAGDRARSEILIWKNHTLNLNPRTREGLGTLAEGWTISEHHYMSSTDPGTLFKGDGSMIKGNIRMITTAAGNGTQAASGDNGSATQAGIYPRGIAADDAGNFFIADWSNHRIRKIDKSGIITTIAGVGTGGYSGDNGPAASAALNKPTGIALDKSGNIYIADSENHRIRKIDKSGIITTIAGIGTGGYSGDGWYATEAELLLPQAIAVDNAGSIYIAAQYNHTVRQITPDGMINTIIGTSFMGYSGDGGLAIDATLSSPSGLAVDNQGNLYIADTGNNRIRKMNSSGIISTYAGNGGVGFSGDKGPATSANIEAPQSIVVDISGNLYITGQNLHRIRVVSPNGIINTIAGYGQSGFSGDNGPALAAKLQYPQGVAVDPAGNIYLSELYHVRKVKLPGVFNSTTTAGDLVFADGSGRSYIMNSLGLHTSTVDTLTGKALYTFEYSNNKLVSMTDRFGNKTIISRDASGKPASITTPFGVKTNLSVNSSDHLYAVTYPDNTGYTLGYTGDGLLKDKYDPKGGHFGHSYDANGMVETVSDPEGGSWNYTVAYANSGRTVSVLTGEGNTISTQATGNGAGDAWRVFSDSSGATSSSFYSADGLSKQTVTTCGMTTTTQYDLDPVYRFKYNKGVSTASPMGLTKTSTLAKSYQDNNSDGIPDLMTTTGNRNGRIWTFVNNTQTGTETSTSPVGRITTLVYDTTTLLLQSITVPGLLLTSYGYDAQGRITSTTTGSRTSAIAYNAKGFVDHITTSDSKTISYTYDEMGRIKTQTLPDTSVITFDYDPNGNLKDLTNPKSISYGFDYTGVDLRKTMTMPLSGPYTYTYDKERNLKTLVFPSGRQIVNNYVNGVLDNTITPEGTTTYTYTCGSNLAGASRNGEAINFVRDGSLLKTDARSGSINQAITYGYNTDFDINSMTYSGISQTFGYDNDGLLTIAGPFTINRNTQNGLPVNVSDGTMTSTRIFSGYGELNGISTTVNGNNAYSYTVPTRDQAGRITQKTETINGTTTTFDYTYDDNGRITDVKRNSTLVEHYTYDPNGNRLTETNTLRGINRSYTASDEDHLLTAGNDSYQFDVDGFLTSKTSNSSTTTYQYSSRGELLSATLPNGNVITYDHDPAGRRIAKKVNGVITEKYLWQSSTKLLAVYDAADVLLMRFTYADGRMPVYMTYNGASYYLMYDQVGSLRVVTDANGSVVKRVDYDTFGNIISDSNTSMALPFGFAGGLHDRDTGLVRFGVRDHAPSIGRWTAKDPIDFAGGDTNLYGYVANDPVNGFDPEGLARKPGKTPPNKWPKAPENVCGKKPKWNPDGYYEGKNGGRISWDDRSHGAGVDRGEGAQDGHWDDENSDNRWDRNGNLLSESSDTNATGWTPGAVVGGVLIAGGILAIAGDLILAGPTGEGIVPGMAAIGTGAKAFGY